MISCNKVFSDFPFAHRQHLHKGHCSLIHGHNWSFEFEFVSDDLDDNGFVVDFGDLDWLKQWLKEKFDHTLVLNFSDPQVLFLRRALGLGSFREGDNQPNGGVMARIITVPNCGAEGLASYCLDEVGKMLAERTNGRVRLAWVTVHEDSKNKATVSAPCACCE